MPLGFQAFAALPALQKTVFVSSFEPFEQRYPA
jgi:hypothetical protein